MLAKYIQIQNVKSYFIQNFINSKKLRITETRNTSDHFPLNEVSFFISSLPLLPLVLNNKELYCLKARINSKENVYVMKWGCNTFCIMSA